MATTIATPTTPTVAYGEVTEAGVGAGFLMPPEIFSPSKQPIPVVRSLGLVVTVDPAPAQAEDFVSFGALADPNLRLRRPIRLDMTTEDGSVILTWNEIDEFGSGCSTTAAMEDFGQSLRELYHHLNAKDVTLGADLERVKRVLDSYIEPR